MEPAQHSGEVALLEKAVFYQVGADAPAVNDLGFECLLELLGGHQLLGEQEVSQAGHGST